MNSAEFQMNLLNKLAFNRYGGTDDEKRAAEILLQQINDLGGNGEIQEFKIPGYKIEKAALTVIDPFIKEIAVTGIGRTGSTEGSIEAELHYAENGEPENFIGAEGKIVLVNTLNLAVYERICKSGALAFITVSGNYFDDEEKTDLDRKYLRDRFLNKCGKLPGVCMRVADGISMLRDGAAKVRLELIGNDEEHTSRNVVSFIEGNEKPSKEILFTAHFDSVIFGEGVWDNASGSVNIMDIYRHFLKNPPRHSMRFIWCGAEEQGLLGSKEYVATHTDEIDNILVCLNFDMTGTVMGNYNLVIEGTDELKYYTKFVAREEGLITTLSEYVHSSDSAPFAHKGVPAVGFTRGGFSSYHTRYDKLFPISSERLAEISNFAIKFAERIDRSVTLPFERAISPAMAEKIKNYIEPKD